MGPGATRRTASASVEAVLSSIAAAAETEDKVHITGFGTFETVTRAARNGYDINTGTRREIPAKRVLTFRRAKTK